MSVLCIVYFCYVFLRLVYPMLSVSLYCLFLLCFFFILCTLCCKFLWIVHLLLAPSVFSNVYCSVQRLKLCEIKFYFTFFRAHITSVPPFQIMCFTSLWLISQALAARYYLLFLTFYLHIYFQYSFFTL